MGGGARASSKASLYHKVARLKGGVVKLNGAIHLKGLVEPFAFFLFFSPFFEGILGGVVLEISVTYSVVG